MQRFTWPARWAFAAYLLALTVLLLVPDPLALLGISRLPGPESGRGVHFCAFLILGFLASSAELPAGRGRVAIVLVIYALTTESLQTFVRSRHVELLDYTENLLGVAAGMGLWMLIERFSHRTH